jgi:hypothetical protein
LSFVEILLPHLAELLAGFALLWAGIHAGAVATKTFVVDAFTWMTQRVLEHIGTLINAAAKAWYWVPGLGPKLEKAAADFNAFATKVNMALESIKDRDVSVRVRMSQTNIGGVRVPVGENGTIPIRGAYADGGSVPGSPGSPQLILAHGGEYVLSREMIAAANAGSTRLAQATAGTGASTSSRPLNVVYTGHARGLEVMFLSWLAKAARTGDLQISSNAIVR